MAWNRRSRAAVDDPAPDTVDPDGPTATGRATPVTGGDLTADGSAMDRTVVTPDPVTGRDTVTEERPPVVTDDTATTTDRAAVEQAERDRLAEREALDQRDTTVTDREAERQAIADRQGVPDPDAPVVTTPDTRPVVAPRRVRARGSLLTTVGLIVSVVGLCGVLTGLLAPEGLVVGLVGVVLSLGGLSAARHETVTGSGAAVFGALVGIAAAVLAILAMTGRFSWPNSRTNEVQVWHDWLVAHWSTLNRW